MKNGSAHQTGTAGPVQPAFNQNRLRAEKLIGSNVLEQLMLRPLDAGCSSLEARGPAVCFLTAQRLLLDRNRRLPGLLCVDNLSFAIAVTDIRGA